MCEQERQLFQPASDHPTRQHRECGDSAIVEEVAEPLGVQEKILRFTLLLSLFMISLFILACSGVISKQGSGASCCRMEVSTPVNSTELRVKVTNLELPQVGILRTAVELLIRRDSRPFLLCFPPV